MKLVKSFAVAGLVTLLGACSSGSESSLAPSTDTNSSASAGGGTVAGSSTSTAVSYYASLPTSANQNAATTLYNAWITKFYVEFESEVAPADYPYLGVVMLPKLQGSARIKYDTPANTVSEGMGYGLLLTCFMNDWTRFDKLFKYYKAYAVDSASGQFYMQWLIQGGFSASASGGSATDADLDALTAMLLAYKKTGNTTYLDYARLVASSIYNTEVNSTTHLFVPANAGDKLSTGYCYNISYFSFVALRLLIMYDTDRSAAWQQVLDASYAYMQQVQNAGNGLWPDWSDANGNPIDPGNSESATSTAKLNNYFGMEGFRIPWRLMWDYYWFGDSRAKAMLDKAAAYANTMTGGNIDKTQARYIYQGDQPSTIGLGGVAPRSAFCALWMSSNTYASQAAACNSELLTTTFVSGNAYFQPSIQMLVLLLLNGFYVQ